jgi:hypothetical protein
MIRPMREVVYQRDFMGSQRGPDFRFLANRFVRDSAGKARAGGRSCPAV